MKILPKLTSNPVRRMMRASEDPLLIHNRLTDPQAIDKALAKIAREPLTERLGRYYEKFKSIVGKIFIAF